MVYIAIIFLFINSSLNSMEAPAENTIIENHYNNPAINPTDIVMIMPTLMDHAHYNTHALMALMYYRVYYYFAFEKDSYESLINPLKQIDWNYLDLSFFKNNQPETPTDHLFWGIQYLFKKMNNHNNNEHQRIIEHFSIAAQSDPRAMYLLGNIYETKNDEFRSFFWLNKSQDQGFIPGLFLTALSYMHGYGQLPNHKKGFMMLLKAARSGFAPAQCLTADYYAKYLSNSKDVTKSWYHKAATACYIPAYFRFGKYLLKETQSEQEFSIAINLLEIATDHNDANAQCELGIYYQNQSEAAARKLGIKYLKQAYSNGHKQASFILARNYIEHKTNKQTLGFAIMNNLASQGYLRAQNYLSYDAQTRAVIIPE